MRFVTAVIFLCAIFNTQAQKSIHQEQLEYYNQLGIAEEDYKAVNHVQGLKPKQHLGSRNNCPLNKIVFGWHPYWSNGKEDQYDWDLMSDLSFFSYEVDPNTGDPSTTHGWLTNDAVDSALANGLRVNLCVTLFSNHGTLFGNPTATQNLINQLISLVQQRGAHGVNIDFEGISSTQKTNFTNFMIDLCNQMHTAIPGSQVSTVLYAVDWNNIFDIQALDPYVDLYTIMGYAYYYSNSSTAGPTDPLYHFGSSYNQTLSKTVTDYLEKGATPSKLVLGLPYYGYEYPVSSTVIPSSTTGPGYARTYQVIKNNTSGNYSAANETWEYNTFSTNYTFNDGSLKQCFINDAFDMSERLEFINHTGIAGMAIWALGYDYGYNEYWNVIYDNFTDCGVKLCVDTLYDFGGPTKNYYDDENYTYTITADNASNLTLDFDYIDIEATYDFLYVYDGPDDTYPQIPGSPFSGVYSAFSFTSTYPEVTFKFISDGATTAPGWKLGYTCSQDIIAPTTTINTVNNWETTDFTVSFTDNDQGSGVADAFYLMSDFDGNKWRSNKDHGFYTDGFDVLHADWTGQTGTWQATGVLSQSDESNSNTNLWTDLTQDANQPYLYVWDAMMNGIGNNRRSGLHFFCDDPTLTNRGNSYFVYFRVDSDKCQIYKVSNDVFTLMTDDPVALDAGVAYNYKVYFDPVTGMIKAYVDGQKVSEWMDSSPHTSGNSVSFRTGNCLVDHDNFKVYKGRSDSSFITIGGPTEEVRYQNQDPFTPACQVYSVCVDSVGLWSATDSVMVNIDRTEAGPLAPIDGFTIDVDTFYNAAEITALWQFYSDTQSTTIQYYYAIGDTPGDSNVVAWTANGLNTIFTEQGLSLMSNTMYYTSVRSENGAGIISQAYVTDGQLLLDPTAIGESEIPEITVYPNPSAGQIYIDLSKIKQINYKLSLYDPHGKLVYSKEINTSMDRLELPQMAKGQYTLVYQDNSKRRNFKLVKL